jgi:hypothetical protein
MAVRGAGTDLRRAVPAVRAVHQHRAPGRRPRYTALGRGRVSPCSQHPTRVCQLSERVLRPALQLRGLRCSIIRSRPPIADQPNVFSPSGGKMRDRGRHPIMGAFLRTGDIWLEG